MALWDIVGKACGQPDLLGGLAFLVLYLVGFPKLFDLFFSFGFGYTIFLLYLSHELVALAGQDVQFIISEFPPLFLHLPFNLLPITLDLIPVHDVSPFMNLILQRANSPLGDWPSLSIASRRDYLSSALCLSGSSYKRPVTNMISTIKRINPNRPLG